MVVKAQTNQIKLVKPPENNTRPYYLNAIPHIFLHAIKISANVSPVILMRSPLKKGLTRTPNTSNSELVRE